MIIFDLNCVNDHPFEGWFRSANDFQTQSEAGMITCPQCGCDEVRRVPSTPNVGAPAPEAEAGAAGRDRAGAVRKTSNIHVDPRSLLRQLTNAMISSTEDVGERFADEARKIHYGESAARGIRGKTTPEERESLAGEGITVLQLPPVDGDDLN